MQASKAGIKRLIIISAVLFVAAQTLFLINIQFPKGHNFDEFHYVPSAKQFLAMTENQNWEHPPLGKMIMAVGISALGDRPIGWRVMSTFFGALTLVGLFILAFAIFRNEQTALFAAAITLVNNLLYVQSRIGMLDTFMFALLVWGLAAFAAAWRTGLNPARTRLLLALAGMLFGFATACKWAAVVPWAICIILLMSVKLLQSWKTSFGGQSDDDWYSPGMLGGMGVFRIMLYLVVIPVFVYFLAFIPFLFIHKVPPYSVLDFFSMQTRMWDGQQRVVTSHPYMSSWTQWPLLSRPIWYAFDKEGTDWVRGVFLVGNPLLMWGGLLALLACLWSWVAHRSRAAFLILAFYAALYLPWAVIPRKIAFYYYYYPAGMMLSLAIAFVFHSWERGAAFEKVKWLRLVFLAAATALFVYFFPILSGMRIPASSFRDWMWLGSWV